MNENVLNTAVKIAKIVDDNVERDVALSKIAQVQAAVNYVDDAWETISQIRYVDIRADAIRRALDNQLTRYISKNETMPGLDLWIDKLMEETLAIPNIQKRCINLQSIILFILPRLDDKDLAISLLKQARNEFAQMDDLVARSKYLFTACEMFLQFNNNDEGTATLELIQERIFDIEPHIQQGLLLGLLAHEYWKMKDYMSAFECIGRVENREIQSYACLQLVEALSNSGLFNDAEPIAEQQEVLKFKNIGKLLISMGRNVFRSFPRNAKNIIFNLNKSYFFYDELDAEDSDDSEDSSANSSRKPTWINHVIIFRPVVKENNAMDQFMSELDSKSVKDDQRSEYKIIHENQIESYVQIISSDKNDSDEDDNDGESWKGSDEDDNDGESWKDSDDDGESWKFSGEENDEDDEDEQDADDADGDDDDEDNRIDDEENDEEDEDEEEEDEEEEDEEDNDSEDADREDDDVESGNDDDDVDDEEESDLNRARDFFSDLINNSLKDLPLHERIHKLHELFVKRVLNLNQTYDIRKDKYFSLMETSQGIISFNQALPPKLLQQLLRKIYLLFHSIKSKKKDRDSLSPIEREKIEDFINRKEDIGFDDAWQEVISQGDYVFAVECALNCFCFQHKSELFFGCEYLYSDR